MKKGYFACRILLLVSSEYVFQIIGGPYDTVIGATAAIESIRASKPSNDSYFVVEVLQ